MKFNFNRPGRTAIIAAVLAVTVLSVGAMAAGHHGHGCRRGGGSSHSHCTYSCTLEHEHCPADCALDHVHCSYDCTLDHTHCGEAGCSGHRGHGHYRAA